MDDRGPEKKPQAPANLYDPAVLEEVQRELAREEAVEQGAAVEEDTGFIPLPELPPVPEHRPLLWLARQVKRVLVVAALVWIVVYAVRVIFFPKMPDMDWEEGRASVPLPDPDPKDAERETRLRDRLETGRAELAAGRFEAGIGQLETLAAEAGESPAGRKAMLTLAATYRFQKNEPEKALNWYRRFVDERRNDRERAATMLRLGGYLEELGRQEDAKSVYRRLIEECADRPKEVDVAKRALARLEKR